jgi:hypothetical protein
MTVYSQHLENWISTIVYSKNKEDQQGDGEQNEKSFKEMLQKDSWRMVARSISKKKVVKRTGVGGMNM